MAARQTPSTFFLIVLNALILFGVTTIGIRNDQAMATALINVFLPLLLISIALQLLIGRILRGRQIGEGSRSFLYLTPVILVVAASLFMPRPEPAPNQTSPLPSPSARYILEVPIQRASWTVRILDSERKMLYEDSASAFYGRFHAYWIWDEEDRAWLFNADSGDVFFWELVDGEWRKHLWGHMGERETEREIDPPVGLFPPHTVAL